MKSSFVRLLQFLGCLFLCWVTWKSWGHTKQSCQRLDLRNRKFYLFVTVTLQCTTQRRCQWGGRRKKGSSKDARQAHASSQVISRGQASAVSSSGSRESLPAFCPALKWPLTEDTQPVCVSSQLLHWPGPNSYHMLVTYISWTCQSTKVRPVLSVRSLPSFPPQPLSLIF